MEIAGELHRSPREVLATITMREFRAYVLLSRDRADEFDDAAEGREDDEVVDLEQEHLSTNEIAAMFGARVVK